jgi:histidinol-phosphate aminotransferase
VRLPYNINVLTQTAATFALDHLDILDGQAAALRAERTRLMAGLAALPGVTTYPSEANFVLARVPDARKTHAALKAGGILIKTLHGAHPLLNQCLRFTVGTPDENDAVLAAMAQAL